MGFNSGFKGLIYQNYSLLYLSLSLSLSPPPCLPPSLHINLCGPATRIAMGPSVCEGRHSTLQFGNK